MIVGCALGWYIQGKTKLITPPPARAFSARQRHAQPRIATSPKSGSRFPASCRDAFNGYFTRTL